MNPRFAALVLSFALTSIASAATSFQVVLPARSTTGVEFKFTVTAKTGSATDAAYTGTIHFTSSDPDAVLPADYTFTPADAGSHQTFAATMQNAGLGTTQRSRSITVTDTGNASIKGTGLTTVEWAPDVVRQIEIDVPETPTRTVPFQGTVSALNADSDVVPGYRGTVHFTGGNGIVVPPDYTFTDADNGTHTFTFTSNRGGFQVIGVKDVSDSSLGSNDSFDVNCPEFTVTASNAGPVCPNGTDQTMLIGTSNQTGVTYSWTGPPSWHSFEQNPSAPGPGTYFLEATNAVGCRVYRSTIVGEKAMPPPAISVPSMPACDGDTVKASVVDAANYSNFEWSLEGPGTIVSGQGTSSIDVAIDALEEWSTVSARLVATYTPSGCRVVNVSYVNADARPSAKITTASSACPNATLTASVPIPPPPSAMVEFSVTNGTITKSVGNMIEYVAGTSGEVVVHARVVPASGCEGTDTAVVTLNGPSATFASPSLAVCPGNSVEIPVDLSGTPPFKIIWSDGLTQSGINATATSRTVAPTEPTSYAIASISDAMCIGTPAGSVTVNIEVAPEIVTEPRDVAVARGQTATLSVAASGHNVLYTWYQGALGDVSHPVASGASRFYTTPAITETTKYWVEAETGCGSARSRTVVVDIATGNKRRAARH